MMTLAAALPYPAVEGLIRSGRVDHLMAYKGGDQDFLALHVWPLIADDDLIAHDSYLCEMYPGTKSWPTQRRGGWDMAGRIDGARRFGHFWDPSMNEWDEAHKDEKLLLYDPSFERRRGHGRCPLACRPPKHPEWETC